MNKLGWVWMGEHLYIGRQKVLQNYPPNWWCLWAVIVLKVVQIEQNSEDSYQQTTWFHQITMHAKQSNPTQRYMQSCVSNAVHDSP